jgi:hypothetical protein
VTRFVRRATHVRTLASATQRRTQATSSPFARGRRARWPSPAGGLSSSGGASRPRRMPPSNGAPLTRGRRARCPSPAGGPSSGGGASRPRRNPGGCRPPIVHPRVPEAEDAPSARGGGGRPRGAWKGFAERRGEVSRGRQSPWRSAGGVASYGMLIFRFGTLAMRI